MSQLVTGVLIGCQQQHDHHPERTLEIEIIIIKIMIIIVSLFYEDDIFSKQCTNITYGTH